MAVVFHSTETDGPGVSRVTAGFEGVQFYSLTFIISEPPNNPSVNIQRNEQPPSLDF